MIQNVAYGILLLTVVLVVAQVYQFRMYLRKRSNILEKSYVVNNHLDRGIALTFIVLSLCIILSVLEFLMSTI